MRQSVRKRRPPRDEPWPLARWVHRPTVRSSAGPADHDLSIIQLRLLAATRLLGVLRDREPTMKQLARLLSLEKSSITGLVDRAERRGLVARLPSPLARRSVLVRLTEHGRSLATEAGRRLQGDVWTMLNPCRAQTAMRSPDRSSGCWSPRPRIGASICSTPPADRR